MATEMAKPNRSWKSPVWDIMRRLDMHAWVFNRFELISVSKRLKFNSCLPAASGTLNHKILSSTLGNREHFADDEQT